MPQVKDRKVSITQRAQAMALLEYGVHISEVSAISKLSTQTLYTMRKRLRERGYRPEINTAFEDRFFKDAPRSGRPIDPNSRRSAKKAARNKSSTKTVVNPTTTFADMYLANLPDTTFESNDEALPFLPESDIDPALTASSQAATESTSKANLPAPVDYTPAPYRKDIPHIAGVTDSALTNHGVLQTKRLGTWLAQRFNFTHIFSSDLQRAYKTALAIAEAQCEAKKTRVEVVQLKVLQEQDFGSFEKMTFAARTKVMEDNVEPAQQPETKEAMIERANQFLDDYVLPLIFSESEGETSQVVVASHGLFLATLWRSFLKRFSSSKIDIASGVELPVRDMLSLEHIGAWSNTGFLELDISPADTGSEQAPADKNPSAAATSIVLLADYKMTILGVNTKDHLQGLKRTGGGVGSSKHDDKQKSIDSFFKKRRTG